VDKSAAVVAVFRWMEEGVGCLLVKRRMAEDDPWSGQVAFPGGRRKEWESNLIETARRELEEEVGLKLGDEVKLLGAMGDIATTNPPILRVRPYIGVLDTTTEVRMGDELAAGMWLPLRSLRRSIRKVNIRGRGLVQVQAFVFGDEVIWGLTAKMLLRMFEVLEPLPESSKEVERPPGTPQSGSGTDEPSQTIRGFPDGLRGFLSARLFSL